MNTIRRHLHDKQTRTVLSVPIKGVVIPRDCNRALSVRGNVALACRCLAADTNKTNPRD